jgi:hypothetical protein
VIGMPDELEEPAVPEEFEFSREPVARQPDVGRERLAQDRLGVPPPVGLVGRPGVARDMDRQRPGRSGVQ